MRNAGLDEAQAGIKIAGRNINNLRYVDDATLMTEKEESSRKTSTSALLITPKPLTVWITTNVENSERDGNTRPPYLSSEKPECKSRSNN